MISEVLTQNATNASFPPLAATATLQLQNRSVPVEKFNSDGSNDAVLGVMIGLLALANIVKYAIYPCAKSIRCCSKETTVFLSETTTFEA